MILKLFSAIVMQLLLLSIAFSEPVSTFNLEETTIDSLHRAIKNKQINCKTIVTTYLTRIKKYNLSVKTRTPINAITQINPSALDQAELLDHFYLTHKELIGPLHCVTVILKDNIDSFDTTTSVGSLALLGNQPSKDAKLVAELRKAGAIILAKAGMDEFAWGVFGISSRSGRIGNAYNPNENPGGSSGGPAAAVSANFALVGIGTDNSGSIRIPAAFNGLFGLRPSTNLISQTGIFPMGNLDGVPGPITRTSVDLALVLDVLAQSMPRSSHIPYFAHLNWHGMHRTRIGIVRRVGDLDTFKNMPAEIKTKFAMTYQTMRELGVTFIDIDLPKFDTSRKYNQAGEIQEVNEYLASFPAVRKNFTDICTSERTRTFGQTKKCLAFIQSVAKKTSKHYQDTLNMFKKNKNYIHAIMDENNLDALLIPISTHGSATYDAFTMNTWRAPVASNAGLPSIAIPIGYSKDNLPIGIELVGKQFTEGTLLAMAYSFEKHTNFRKTPELEESDALMKLSIPELNNLFSQIGMSAYEKVIKNSKSNSHGSEHLTPEVFRKIVTEVLRK